MKKEQFKKRWESNDKGGGIIFDDIADCAKKWGVCSKLRINQIEEVRYKVLKAAGVEDAEDYNPHNKEDAEKECY